MINYLSKIMTTTAFSFCVSMASPAFAQSDFDAKFKTYPTYAGNDLELIVDHSGTHWRLWSPKAQEAIVKLYDHGKGEEPIEIFKMEFHPSNGTWTASSPSQLYGKFYTFQIKYDGKWLDETPGIWAKSVGVNGKRAAIIDLSKTNPKGWESDKGPKTDNFSDVIIYEMHHRDFSMHPSSGITNKGKFIALTEKGTTSPSGEKTGIDHLKELGITHVHILPSYDYNSVDESNLQNNTYNWGYDPQNYNAPEGSYSTNPDNPSTRVEEMKEMIMSLHDAGIGVIMDVVYNHTAENDGSNFSLTAPGYFYRHRKDGSYSDASGCGNETASELQQMQDFIVNSVKYWAQEYHIDGFRFDLMAIHDTETMNRVAKELKDINPSIFVYGEGWTAGDSPLLPERRALKENVSKMENVAVFSDDLRDAVKGHFTDASDRGFATGKPGLEETVKIGIVAATPHPQVDYSKGNNSKFAYASSPEMIVNYISCHDDLCLTDKLKLSMKEESEENQLAAAKLAQTIVFTSQGTPFIFAGEEIFRDKKGVHNSYNKPDSINAINWNNKSKYRDQFNYYKGLIELRKSHPAFRMTNAKDISSHLVFDQINTEKTPNLISYSLIDHANDDSWKEIKVVFNGSPEVRSVHVPEGEWKIVAMDGKIDPNGNLGTIKGGNINMAPYSALILAME